MRTAIRNGRVIAPDHRIVCGGVLFEDGKILGIFEGEPPLRADETIDAQGHFVSPGFIDLHTHGGGGYDFMDGTPEAFMGAAKAHMRHGTTSLVPTTLTSSDAELLRAFECFRQAKRQMRNGPALLGLHLEGPYFNPEQAGAQDPRYLRAPTREHYLRLLDASEDILRVSAAPELPGALALGDELRRRGILASIGHSSAEYEDVKNAVRHGYTHVTHFYSAMSMLRRRGPWRRLGIVESAYLMDELSVEIIADGCHLPPELLRLIVKQKPMEQICLITDSMRGAGMPEGEIVKLGSLANGQDTVIEQGVAMLMDRSAFAGSVCTADRCIRTMVKLAGLSVADAVAMMTANPARIIGAKNKGELAFGKDADICIFDDEIRVHKVLVRGKVTAEGGACL